MHFVAAPIKTLSNYTTILDLKQYLILTLYFDMILTLTRDL